MTILLACTTFTVTFGSSIFSSTIAITAKEFNTTETVMLLGVSLYVLGFSFGPVLWGPMSEVLGRKIPLFTGYLIFALLQIPTALSRNLAGLLVCRFLAGAFGAAPVVLVSASYSDFWEPAQRGTAAAAYSTASFAGPTMGPIIGTFIVESHLGWRWTAWLTLILAGVFGPAAFILVPETYEPVLKKKTKPTVQAFIRTFLIRPALMLKSELMVWRSCIYAQRLTVPVGCHDNLYLHCLWHSVSQLLRCSLHLQARSQLETNDCCSAISRHARWYPCVVYVCSLVLQQLLSTSSPSSTLCPTRRSPPADHAWERAHADRPVLAGLDLSRVMGGAGHLALVRGSWDHVDLHEWCCVHHRHLSQCLGKCAGSQHHRQKCRSRWFALGCTSYV